MAPEFDTSSPTRPELDPTQPELSKERQEAWDKANGYNPNAPENQWRDQQGSRDQHAGQA